MPKLLLLLAGLLGLATPASAQGVGMSAHDFTFTAIDGGALPLSAYRGKALLVVNTASRCGFTKQYEDLQKLYSDYTDRGLVVLGVPSNDFMGQVPGTNEEIKKFCETSFGITFPMTEKVSVKGGSAHPFFQWAAGQDNGGTPKWNFHKYLIAPDGTLAASFGSTTGPYDQKLITALESIL
jgi:glutathione peroxidase